MKHRAFFIIIPILFITLTPLVVMLLWNNILTTLFLLKSISYFQSLGLLLLCRILFGRFRFSEKRRPPILRNTNKEKWLQMNEEERKAFKNEWKKRSCK